MYYYLALRPQTVVSIIYTGKLPEVLPVWFFPRKIILYANSKKAVEESGANKAQEVFLLEIFRPDSSAAAAGGAGSISLVDTDEKIEVGVIDTKQIQKILVNSETGKKLLMHLLNKDSPFSIEIVPDHFTSFIASTISKTTVSFIDTVTSPIATKPTLLTLEGDILGSRAQTLINTVNCVGVMGKGIALLFKNNYPEMFDDYKLKCDKGEVKLGVPYLYKVSDSRWILNFPTKAHWRNDSNLKDIENGLIYLAKHAAEWGITSLAVPPLGCGNGKLNWDDVYPLILHHLRPLGIPIEVYVPFHESKAAKPSAAKRAKISSSLFTAYSEPVGIAEEYKASVAVTSFEKHKKCVDVKLS